LRFEYLTIAYFVFFTLAAPCAAVAWRRRARTSLSAAVAAIGVLAAITFLPQTVRLWLPFLYIAAAYWIPVPLVPSRGGGAFEAWLRRTDAAARRHARPPPLWLAQLMELGYLTCFPLVPISFAAVWSAGSRDDVGRFWTAALAAGFACYGTLPWLVSAPPRLIEPAAAAARTAPMTRANVSVLGIVSHRLNTFPSGHVAVSAAAALSVVQVWPLAGAVLCMVTVTIAAGAVVGRYHFVVDVVLGALIGGVAWISAWR
jgi:hypothetical protein